MHSFFLKIKSFFYLWLLLLIASYSCSSDKKQNYQEVKVVQTAAASTFVGSETCKSCHQQEFTNWEGSHHDNAMKEANAVTVLGDFNDVEVTFKNISSRFFKKGDDFYVNTEDINGDYKDFKIEYTFGITPLQQYLIRFDNGEYQCLTTAWDSVKNEWFSLLRPNLDIVHGDRLHWTGSAMSWNTMCADCHSTDLKKNYDIATDTYKTTFSEINVSCEACHGPSSSHVNYYQNPDKEAHPPTMYMHTDMTSEELVDKCARCHSRRSQITEYFDYEGEFFDHYSPSNLIEGLYYSDGQINDEVYVYGSFVQSKMYHNGISCKDCHDVHSLKLKKQGNDLCLSCHTPNYNEQSHHFHPLNSEGAQCINCHMTGKTYMGNDFRRDHSFRVPRPDQSVQYGTPNACTGCHTDKSDEWARDAVITQFGEERADHFSDHLLKGYYQDPSAFEVLMANKSYPAIARATAVNYFGGQYIDNRQLSLLTSYLKDSSALVRNEVIATLERIQYQDASKLIQPLLNDSIRMVRISAASYMNFIQEDVTAMEGYKAANKEYLTTLEMNADFASGQHQLGLYYQAKGDDVNAVKAYERAIEIDNYYNRSRMNLALLYYNQGKTKESEQLYLKVIDQEPDFGYSYYMLGLLYNETGENEKALNYLGQATLKNPPNQNAFYNYALKLQEIKEYNASINTLNEGLQLFPYSERMLYAKFIAEMNTNQTAKAKESLTMLMQIAPNNQNYKQLFQQLNQ